MLLPSEKTRTRASLFGNAMRTSTIQHWSRKDLVRSFGRLSPEQVKALDEVAAKIRAHTKATTKAMIDIGGELMEVKRKLPHGVFTKWVTVDCGFTMRSAQNYMRAAEFAQGKSETVALLAPAALYRLSTKNAPREIVAEVLDSLEAGRVPTECEILGMFEGAREHPDKVSQREPGVQEDRRSAAALASEILSRLGPDLARKLTASRWDLVIRCLLEQVEGAEPSAADVGMPDTRSASPCVEGAVDLVRDSDDPNLFRPEASTLVPDLEADAEDQAPVQYCTIDHSQEGAIPADMCRTGLPHPAPSNLVNGGSHD